MPDLIAGPPLFVTRKFPPSVGGMETLAEGVWRSLSSTHPGARLIAHGGPNKALAWWLPMALLRTLWLLVRRRVGIVVTGDALTHAVIAPAAWVLRVPCATMVMGLDVTYRNPVYRACVLPVLRHAGHVISISRATARAAEAAGVPGDRISVVRLGVRVPPWSPERRRRATGRIRENLGLPDSAVLLVMVGRLVPRKGAVWFVEHVFRALPDQVHLAVAGDGPDRGRLEAAVTRLGLEMRVHLLGRVADDLRDDLMVGADLFVQPNIPVPGDMEGFGLVAIEAALRGTPVVAADLEGLRDAVVDGATGRLLPSGEAAVWQATLLELTGPAGDLAVLGEQFRARAVELYGEQAMASALASLLNLQPPSRQAPATHPADTP